MAKIVVVDDSEVIRVRLRQAIQGHGHDVYEAVDGARGLEIVAAHPDAAIVFTDQTMPGMDGTTMCHRIQSDVSAFGGTLVMLTTETDFGLKARSKEAGIRYWMTKPIDDRKLSRILAKLVASHR